MATKSRKRSRTKSRTESVLRLLLFLLNAVLISRRKSIIPPCDSFSTRAAVSPLVHIPPYIHHHPLGDFFHNARHTSRQPDPIFARNQHWLREKAKTSPSSLRASPTAAENGNSFPLFSSFQDNNKNKSKKKQKKKNEFPTIDIIPWIQQQIEIQQERQTTYLQKHQIVKKRRVLKRSFEIFTILAGQILRPLLCSAVTMKPDLANIHLPQDEDWDAFWNYQKRTGGLTNAQRVAKGIPKLGPTFVKFGQVLSTRPDILHGPLAQALLELQDNVPPFADSIAKRIIRTDLNDNMQQIQQQQGHVSTTAHHLTTSADLDAFMESLSEQPVASGSIAQVYKGYLPGYGHVAVKVKRPGIQQKVERDATLFHSLATWIESIVPGKLPLVATVNEFTARVLEDMDFQREASNIQTFANLYCGRRGGSSPTVQVIVPELLSDLCSDRILVMEWLEGTKLTDVCNECDEERQENLELVKQAIEITLSQMIDHGLLHGEPHSANLLKIPPRQPGGKAELGYLDFGLVTYMPKKIRDGIVCAVVQIVFARNMEALADLCVDLGMLPKETLQDNPAERSRFVMALQQALDDIMIWPTKKKTASPASNGKQRRRRAIGDFPKIRFENLLPALSNLVLEGFDFKIPPYFLNNVRALATLEGIALELDPDFNILQVIYPYSINRMMRNPSISKQVQETFVTICKSPETKLISPRRVNLLLNDWALLTGYRKRKICWDLMVSAGGRRVTPVILKNFLVNRVRNLKGYYYKLHRITHRLYEELVWFHKLAWRLVWQEVGVRRTILHVTN